MPPARTATDREDVQDGQDTLETEVAALQDESLGFKSNPVAITFGGAGSEQVNHGLGRLPVGWLQSDLVGAGVIVDRVTWDKNTITFRASGACTFAARVN